MSGGPLFFAPKDERPIEDLPCRPEHVALQSRPRLSTFAFSDRTLRIARFLQRLYLTLQMLACGFRRLELVDEALTNLQSRGFDMFLVFSLEMALQRGENF